MTDTPIRVLVVDDHELVRAGLRGVLGSDASIDVIAEASDGLQAVAAVEVHHPDVVVMDLQMPGMGGIEATRRIVAARPGTAVLALTMFDDDDSVFAAVRAGAPGVTSCARRSWVWRPAKRSSGPGSPLASSTG